MTEEKFSGLPVIETAFPDGTPATGLLKTGKYANGCLAMELRDAFSPNRIALLTVDPTKIGLAPHDLADNQMIVEGGKHDHILEQMMELGVLTVEDEEDFLLVTLHAETNENGFVKLMDITTTTDEVVDDGADLGGF